MNRPITFFIFILILLSIQISCSSEDRINITGTMTPVDPLPTKTIEENFIPNVTGNLTKYSSNISWQFWNYTLNANNTVTLTTPRSIVSTNFNGIVIENQYIRVTLLPEFGGRIVSIFYKPTGHEQLYQNPIGTPYGVGDNNFYHNWLMVYSGIFPTFPEPEHGKYWFKAWSDTEIVNTSDQVSIKMSMTDTLETTPIPWKFSYGKTGLTCEATVTVYKARSIVDFDIKLINSNNSNNNYEYWTCTTLTPGSTAGNTKSPYNSEIIVPIEQIKLKDDWWSWMASAEQFVSSQSGGNIYKYQNLALFGNWDDMGIGYAYPSVTKNWWGVINHDNEVGIFRIANNQQNTPGLKFWTWGYNQSYATDPITSPTFEARPYIELWAGNSLQFFSPATINAYEEKSWKESYISTVGLSEITHANQNGACYLTINKNENSTTFISDIFTSIPNYPIKAYIYLIGNNNYCLTNHVFNSDPQDKTTINLSIPKSYVSSGSYQYQLTLETTNGLRLLQTSINYSH